MVYLACLLCWQPDAASLALAPPEYSGSRYGSWAGILQTVLGNIKILLRVALGNWSWILISIRGSLAFQSSVGCFASAKIYYLHGKSNRQFAFWCICLDLLPRQKFFYLGQWNFVRYIWRYIVIRRKNCSAIAHLWRMQLWFIDHSVSFTPTVDHFSKIMSQ
jgi:hypothetical protein